MINHYRPISISLSPNVQEDDIKLARRLLLLSWQWKKGTAILELENEFRKYLGVQYAVSFNSGRSALYAILKALDLNRGSDVLLQAFTCNAVPNPVLWADLNPLYVDCGNDFNIDIEDLKRKISNNTKVIILQHTFGLPANITEVKALTDAHGIILIEDCAHALGAEYQGKQVGTFGKAGFFSFSRDKVISCVYGGMAVTNDEQLGKELLKLQKEFGYPSASWIQQQIFHPLLLNYVVLPIYNFINLGKLFLVLSQWSRLLSKAVSWKEKRGVKPNYFPKALPNALAMMALHQFKKLDQFSGHRKKIAHFYYQELVDSKFVLPKNDGIFLRFAVQHPNAHEIIYEAWHNQNILLGDWYTTAIAPDDTQMDEMKYKKGECSNAEILARRTLNLPTHINISMEEAERVVSFLKKFK